MCATLCHSVSLCVTVCVDFVVHACIMHLYVGCLSANLDLISYVPGGSELGGDDMCSMCMDNVS